MFKYQLRTFLWPSNSEIRLIQAIMNLSRRLMVISQRKKAYLTESWVGRLMLQLVSLTRCKTLERTRALLEMKWLRRKLSFQDEVRLSWIRKKKHATKQIHSIQRIRANKKFEFTKTLSIYLNIVMISVKESVEGVQDSRVSRAQTLEVKMNLTVWVKNIIKCHIQRTRILSIRFMISLMLLLQTINLTKPSAIKLDMSNLSLVSLTKPYSVSMLWCKQTLA